MKVRTLQIVLALLLAGPRCGSQTLAFNEVKPQFGSVAVGKSSEPKIISISNVSSAPIFLLYIRARQDFTQSNECPMWLPESSGCLVFITFTPVAAGPRTGQLYVQWAGGGEQSISLNGLGLPPQDSHDATVPQKVERASRTTNDEEMAHELINDKRYSFQDLLNKSPGAIANSETVFALTKETQRKQRIASILLSIGVKDRVYFDYLTDEARKALAHDHDMPWPLLYGNDWEPKGANPAMNEWCEKHNLPFWDMYRVSYYEITGAWYFLAAAGDPRTYDLLVKGLHSPNPMIAAMAAHGLAKLQDPRAIEELIATGRKVPVEARGGIAEALLFFPDPKAQAAANEILPDKEKNLLEVWRRDIKARGLKVLFPW